MFYLSTGTNFTLDRFTIEGSGSGTTQHGLQVSSCIIKVTNGAIYNTGDYGFLSSTSGITYFDNVNIGVEAACGDDDIYATSGGQIIAKDLKLGGNIGYVYAQGSGVGNYPVVQIENYQKVLGEHRTYWGGGYYKKTLVTGATTPNKKLSDYVLEIIPNISGEEFSIPEQQFCVFETEIFADTGSQTLKYWVFNDIGATLNDVAAQDNVWLEIEYVAGFSATPDPDVCVMKKVISDGAAMIDILDNGGDTDWDYLEATINPAVASKVRCKIYWSKYSAAGEFFIDPQVVIS